MNKTQLILSESPLDLNQAFNFTKDPSCGAIECFIGTVRNHNKGEEVKRLEFSAYKPMAIKEMQKIADQCLELFEIKKIAIHHAVGSLEIGEIPVIIAASSAHKEAAQQACSHAIKTLKETVPIWKKEHTTKGHVWINAHP